MKTILSRYGDIRNFDLINSETYYFYGKWHSMRCGFVDDPNVLTMIDPDGGPYIAIGTNLKSVDSQLEDFTVGRIEKWEDGYLLHRKRLTVDSYVVT
jgi:hypothetical protein